MSEQMKLQKYALIAEIVGALAIIVSLIFVGLQIADGNREARAATLQSALNAEMDMLAVFAENADPWDKVLTGQPLTPGGETRRAILLYNLLMTDTENRYLQYRSGYLDASSWEARQSILPAIVGLPIFETWHSTPGAMNHSVEFLSLLDSIADANPDE